MRLDIHAFTRQVPRRLKTFQVFQHRCVSLLALFIHLVCCPRSQLTSGLFQFPPAPSLVAIDLPPHDLNSGVHSGVETPDRFTRPHLHPPQLSPRYVQSVSPDLSSGSLLTLLLEGRSERSTRNDIHSPRAHTAGRSRISRARSRRVKHRCRWGVTE